ncbi:hypothetical protein M752DRAFT_296405 [Aspergillus phoenicis ATCC 13157]|uniref:Aminoglycoside phosphotransferase domain-containing protein n=1 Tax=Aspergillus phoenicis ATCC 13157 TaxID=1353007 RepID=A0A370PAZ1_ASPPH|nr:hypothetical protein M752DRAFT_296405 [Aspergillus phoenicis ATCC 13157]
MSTAEEEKQNVQSVDAGPKVNILYSAPGFAVPEPDSINAMVNPSNTIFNWGGVQIVKISPEVVVKFGSHVTLNEAKSMMFVDQNTETVPVPKIYAYYSYGPIDREFGDYGSFYDNYIFMSFVEGRSLNRTWESYDSVTKSRVANQLKGYFDELRQIDHSGYIGSVGRGPVADPILEDSETKGPFDSEDDFDNAIISAYQSRAPKRHIKNVLADVRVLNIMVHNGNITGIVDWDLSG